MNNILEIKNLSVCFKGHEDKDFTAVKDFSANLEKGKVLGIVGESGSGKSVTALSILGLLPENKVSFGAKSSIKFEGKELIGANNEEMRQIRGNQIGFIFQEPQSSLNPLHRIGGQIAENLLIHQNLNAHKAHAHTVELLKEVGILNPKVRYKAFPFELSGGQRQRVMIAMAIANNPKILIADEPTTALDVTIQAQIINLLKKLQKTRKMSIIFISHDLRLVRQIADDVIVMHKGEIVEKGSVKDIFEKPHEDYTKNLINGFGPLIQDKNLENELSAKIENISVSYPLEKSIFGRVLKKMQAVENVSLKLFKGQTLGIVGESGSGKTTLGLSMANLIKHQGQVTLYPAAKTEKDFRRRVQIVFQDPYNSLNPRLTVLQIVGEGLRIHFPGLKNVEIRQKVLEILKETGLNEEDLDKYPHQFSGGQRQRIAIARALILEPEIVILDEPTSALDVTVQRQILELLRKLQQKHRLSYIFISHDMRAIRALADEIAVMKDGRIIERNTAEKIFESPRQWYTQELIAASVLK